ncbi:MAG: PaaI family thioesterase [Oscillospiraceae bacterium]|nr:PaaI family thioesterase [Oscillospiraceae bacterium]
MTHLEYARELFQKDLYATECTGAVIEAAEPGHAVCTLRVEKKHQNAGGVVMGGAIFTLADFAFAVAANMDRLPTVAQSAQIAFLSPGRGRMLRAEAICVKRGRTTAFFRTDVTDEEGNLVASVTTNGYYNGKTETE